jgi:hypothetical protein
MKLRKLKVRSHGAVEPAMRASATAQSSCITLEERQSLANRSANMLSLTSLALVLQKLIGGALSAIGVSVQVGTVFICAAILLLGPLVALGLLP